MSNNNAQSNHSSSTSSSDALVKFPSSNERASFDDWLFRAEVFLRAKGMLDVVRQPIFNLPEEKNGVFIRRANIQYLGLDDNDVLVQRSLIIQTKHSITLSHLFLTNILKLSSRSMTATPSFS